ncbi:MAG TPA: hypothetical protein VLG09_00225 [Candidatus Saccharimonadales bacterium]|nr:hypothetical protein [Candidatus Saccharimonadales bacterium]
MERLPVEIPSHYEDLLDIVTEEQALNVGGIPISTIDSLMPRSNQAPFAEGETFSGNIRHGDAEASLTLAASSHFRPTIPLKDFISKASEVFGQEAKLPGELPADQKIAPHMIVWWQAIHEMQRSQVNLFDLSVLPSEDRINFIHGINAQVVKAFSALDTIDGRPVIYGSWGNSEPESRARFGFSRGAPTLPDGHLHLAKVNIQDQDISLKSLPPIPALKHYQPWNRLINQQFGPNIAHMLDRVLRDDDRVVEGVRFYDEIVRHNNSHNSHQQGYEVTYQDPLPLEVAMEHIIYIAGEFEGLYQGMHSLYTEYYKNSGDPEVQQQIFEQMQEIGAHFGFDSQAAKKLASFVTRIVPTSSQLNEWSTQLEKDAVPDEEIPALEAIRRQLARRAWLMARNGGDASRDSILTALIKDTYRDPEEHEIIHTWPAHSSAIYLLDDIVIDRDKVLVKKFSIHPAIVAAAGAPEKILGAAIVRDMGSAA